MPAVSQGFAAIQFETSEAIEDATAVAGYESPQGKSEQQPLNPRLLYRPIPTMGLVVRLAGAAEGAYGPAEPG